MVRAEGAGTVSRTGASMTKKRPSRAVGRVKLREPCDGGHVNREHGHQSENTRRSGTCQEYVNERCARWSDDCDAQPAPCTIPPVGSPQKSVRPCSGSLAGRLREVDRRGLE